MLWIAECTALRSGGEHLQRFRRSLAWSSRADRDDLLAELPGT